MANIGTSAIERESTDTPQVGGASLGISAWAICSPRGVPGRRVRCAGFSTVKRIFFGSPNPAFLTYYMLRGLYSNAENFGAVAHIVRVVGSGATAAKCFATKAGANGPASHQGSNNLFPLKLNPGDLYRVDVGDLGTIQDVVFQATAAAITGSAGTFALISGEKAVFRVGSPTAATQELTFGSESGLEQMALKLNQLAGATVQIVGGELKLIDDKIGQDSFIEFVSASDPSVATSLGLTVGTSDTGSGNVQNIHQVSFEEFKSLTEVALTQDQGLSVALSDSGAPVLVTNKLGAAAKFEIINHGQFAKFGFTAGLYTGNASSSANIWRFTAGQFGAEDPGTWANGRLFYQILAPSNGDTANYRNIQTFFQPAGEPTPILQETWTNIPGTGTDFTLSVNHPDKGSGWVKVDVITAGQLPDIMANPAAVSAGTPGADGATPAENAYEAALSVFSGANVQIVLAPDLQTPLMASKLDTYAKTRGDVLALATAPFDAELSDLEAFAVLKVAKSFTAPYTGWVRMDDEVGGTVWVPPLGHLIGAGCIRKVQARGGFPHIAPAGVQAAFNDVIEVRNGSYDADRLKLVNQTGFNPIVFQEGDGILPKTSRTFSTTDKWYSIHVRIQLNFFKVAFVKTFSPFEQDGNTEEVRRKVKSGSDRFMEDQYDNGGIEQEGGYANNVRIVCDLTNNTQAVRQERKLVENVTYRPVEVIESIEIVFTRTTEGLQAQEI